MSSDCFSEDRCAVIVVSTGIQPVETELDCERSIGRTVSNFADQHPFAGRFSLRYWPTRLLDVCAFG